MLKRSVACGVLLLAGWALCGPASAQTAPAFTETACDLPDVPPGVLSRLRCGTVSVPRDYGLPDAGRFGLAVVVVQSERQPALPDPLLYVSGGPGAPLTIHAGYQGAHPYAPGRDLILVDQRGTGRSEPHLCPGLRGDIVNAAVAVAMGPEAPAQVRHRAAFAACREEAAAGVNLDDFGTTVTAEDLDTVRRALGVGRWNVFGVSYGTTVAMTLMARHPETIRAAVLDSMNPPDYPLLPLASANVAEARGAFFRFCSEDEACASAYPGLAATYEDTLKRLAQSPPPVRLPTGVRPSGQGPLTAALFELVVGQLIYYPKFYPGLPRLIAAVHDGDTTDFASSLASLLAEARDPDYGMNLAAGASISCRDRPRYREPLAEGAGIFERVSLYGICDNWSDPGPPPVVPLDTDVPTLVLAGEFDPNATPAVSRHVADLIGRHAQWIEFAHAGHSVRATNPCARGIVADFMTEPARPLDMSCASRPEPIRFLPKQ